MTVLGFVNTADGQTVGRSDGQELERDVSRGCGLSHFLPGTGVGCSSARQGYGWLHHGGASARHRGASVQPTEIGDNPRAEPYARSPALAVYLNTTPAVLSS